MGVEYILVALNIIIIFILLAVFGNQIHEKYIASDGFCVWNENELSSAQLAMYGSADVGDDINFDDGRSVSMGINACGLSRRAINRNRLRERDVIELLYNNLDIDAPPSRPDCEYISGAMLYKQPCILK
jgi:hypothetical protein